MVNITREELFSITTYSQVCEKFEIREHTLEEFEGYRGHAKKFFAFFKLKVIEKLFNGDWTADWNDTRQRKWYPYFYRDNSGGWVDGVFACVDGDYFGSGVAYFRDEETAIYVGKTFKDIYLELIL